MCEESYIKFVLDENNLFTWNCRKHQRGGLIEYKGKHVFRVHCPPRCYVSLEQAQQNFDELLRNETILIAQDRAAGRRSVRPLDQTTVTAPQEKATMLNGKTNTPNETPKNETPTEAPVDVTPTAPSIWQRTKETVKTGYSAIPLKREGTCFSLGMAAMYAIQRGATYYLDHSAEVNAVVIEAVVDRVTKK